MLFLLAAGLDLHPFDLIRVEDPAYPDAVAVSATGAVALEPPPPGVPWSWESVPELDGWTAEEALGAMNVSAWHDAGYTGAGVKIAVFDLQWFGAEADPDELGDVETHDCWFHESCIPPMDTWRPRFGFEQGVHGLACAEVIRDIAPDAELHLVRVNGRTTLENAVAWAIREDIDVISMSLSFFSRSFYDGTGPINRMMEDLALADVLMVTSAGNYARGHWTGRYIDADGDGHMDFDGDNGLPVYLNAGDTRGIYVAWDQYGACGETDLNATLYDSAGRVLFRADDPQDPHADRCVPEELVQALVERSDWYWLELDHARGRLEDVDVDILVNAGAIFGSMPGGSIADPGSSPLVFTVGAVDAEGYLTNGPEPYSSQGPTLGGHAKPDIAGPDGLSTSAYGAQGFYGTSASTPSVAGALALILSRWPHMRPRDAADQLRAWAWGDGTGFDKGDPRWGAGKARLPVPDAAAGACGRRPLLALLALFPLGLLRRRRRRADLG